MAKPKPVPPKRCDVEALTWEARRPDATANNPLRHPEPNRFESRYASIGCCRALVERMCWRPCFNGGPDVAFVGRSLNLSDAIGPEDKGAGQIKRASDRYAVGLA